ncbi:ADP-ribosylglycohydrolase family protein [Shivajiella indica]|uniref:ADP-ribosylglycohydrolase family protein n=1 Tax=Shivajiella indica TaxID=872115 RepID=A0ABW5B8G0_9BACT
MKSTYINLIIFHVVIFILFSCKKGPEIVEPSYQAPELSLSEGELYDKVLGMLVGSAIGDAMGAPTEMWSRENIYSEYGFVTDLDTMIREVSPEGIWKPNLPAGGTTDDTRWKILTVNYLFQEDTHSLKSDNFAAHILKVYQEYLLHLNSIDTLDVEAYENALLKVNWLKEWAKVSKPYIEKDLYGFEKRLSTFYGGEMVCGGLLYGPVIGAFFPEDPQKAYSEAHKLALYDIGYAKDISALSAAMTSAAMSQTSQNTDLIEVLRNIDPEDYYGSRLVGRTSYRILQTAFQIVSEFKEERSVSSQEVHLDYGEMKWDESSLKPIFLKLDLHLQDMPFHAGEIYLQVLTAMIFADFDFEKTLIFLVNYGRDNDTTAAIAGAILGAYYGFDKLPVSMKRQVLEVNKKELNIDLEKAAKELSQKIMSRYP